MLTTDVSNISFYRVVGDSVGGGDDVEVTSLLSAGTRTQDSSMVTQIFTISPSQALVGEDVYAIVNYTDGNNNAEEVSSSTFSISNVNDIGRLRAITGTARQGEVLTVGTITDLDGGITPTAYQWLADDTEISGAIASSYTLTQSEVGAVITVRVTYDDAFSSAQVLLSSGTSAVENVDDTAIFDNSATATVTESTTSVLTVQASDIDEGQEVSSYRLATPTFSNNNILFAIVPDTGVLTFLAAPDFENPQGGTGNDSNDYIVVVEALGSSGEPLGQQVITVTVTDESDADAVFANDTNINVNENSTAVVTVQATDPDTEQAVTSYSLSSSTDSSLFAIVPDTGVLTFLVAPDFENPQGGATDDSNTYTVIVNALDNNDIVLGTQTLTINVIDAQDLAIFTTSSSESVVENSEEIILTVNAEDEDTGDRVISYRLLPTGSNHNNALFTLTLGGNLSFMSSPDFENPQGGTSNDSNNYIVIVEALGTSNEVLGQQTITITVTNESDAGAVFNNNSVAVAENTTSVLTVQATDSDEGETVASYNLSSEQVSNNDLFSINSSTGVLVFNNAPDFENPLGGTTGNSNSYIVVVNALDENEVILGTETITVTVTDENEALSSASLSNAIFSLAVISDVSNRIRLADINVVDDALGTNAITLSGTNASDFQIVEENGVFSLYLRSGTTLTLDATFDVAIEVDDSTVGSSPDVTIDYTLTIVASDSTLVFEGGTSITEGDAGSVTGTYILTDGPNSALDSLSTINDIDVNTVTEFAGVYGTLTLSGTNFDYVLNANANALLTLKAEETAIERFVFETTEGLTRNLEIVVTGIDTPPTDIVFTGTGITDGGGINGIPFNLSENVTGSIITLATEDFDDDNFTYSIASVSGVGADESNFTINTTTGELSVSTALDFETVEGATVVVTVNVNDGTNNYNEDITITVVDVNEAAQVSVSNEVRFLTDSIDVSNRIKVADIVITDDALGTNDLSLANNGDNIFILEGTELFVAAGVTLVVGEDLSVDIQLNDESITGEPDSVTTFTINVLESDTTITFSGEREIIEGSTEITGSYLLINGLDGSEDSFIAITGRERDASDDFLSSEHLGNYGVLTSLSGGQYSYLLNNTQEIIELKEGETLQDNFIFETTEGVTSNLTITIVGVNSPPTNMTFIGESNLADSGSTNGASLTVEENFSGTLVTAIVTDDPEQVDFTYSISSVNGVGASLSDFTINENSGQINTTGLDFESVLNSIILTVVVNDGANDFSEDITITVVDVNEAPTGVSLSSPTRLLADTTSTANRIKLSDIIITDDALGTNTITLSGADVAHFEYEGTELYLSSETEINADDTFDVTITVVDEALSSPPLTVDFSLSIISNPATIILTEISNEDLTERVELSLSTVAVVEALEEVIDDETIGISEEDIRVIETLTSEYGATENIAVKQELVEELVPVVYTTIAPAVENIVGEVAKSVNTRSLGSLNVGLVGVSGPDAKNSSEKNLHRGNFWHDLSYSKGSRDSNESVPGYEHEGYSIRLGYERLYGNTFLGAGIFYGDSNIDNTNSQGSADIDTIALSLYRNKQKDNHLYMLSFIFAFSDIQASRERQVLGNLDGESSSIAFDVEFTYGYINKTSKKSKLTYLTGLRYGSVFIDSISESGTGLALETEEESYDSLYFKFGTIFSFDLESVDNTRETVSFYADYNLNLLDLERNVSSQFVNGGSKFETTGIDEDSSSFTLGVGYKYTHKSFTWELGYNYRVSSISNSNNFNLKLKHQF